MKHEYLAHPLTETPPHYRDGMSRTMVIDMDGNRTNFQMAFYDFDNKVWQFMEEDTSMLEVEHAKWLDILPYADHMKDTPDTEQP